MRVDEALDLAAIPDDHIAVARGVSGAPVAGAVAGVAALDDGLVVIHDLDAFLSAAEAGSLDAALAAHEHG
jgi:purine-binding chemotaxis protein CheW